MEEGTTWVGGVKEVHIWIWNFKNMDFSCFVQIETETLNNYTIK
jgi:hypothetical protein